MRISVIGCGYLGAVHAACMAALGHDVIGVDVDHDKVRILADGMTPFHEPGLPELLTEVLATGRLSFTNDMSRVAGADVHFVCVGTPQKPGKDAADLTYVDAAFTALAPFLRPGDLVVGKSTVPVGTAGRLAELLRQLAPDADPVLAWNPEFLREGFAVHDTMTPDRFVYGVTNDLAGERAVGRLDAVFATALATGTPKIVTDYATAELVKVAANSFLATKISFINAMAEVCETVNADVTVLADAIGHDDRIGRKFLGAGLGFGGGCLPKDIRAFVDRAGELGADQAVAFLREVDSINLRQRERMVDMTLDACDGSVGGKRIAILGAAFKPDSDDIRDSPALDVAVRLQQLGGDVVVTDPQALDNARKLRPQLSYTALADDACRAADVVLLLTEWADYRNLDPVALGGQVRGRQVLDGRNALDPASWRAAGWTYRSLGRPRVAA